MTRKQLQFVDKNTTLVKKGIIFREARAATDVDGVKISVKGVNWPLVEPAYGVEIDFRDALKPKPDKDQPPKTGFACLTPENEERSEFPAFKGDKYVTNGTLEEVLKHVQVHAFGFEAFTKRAVPIIAKVAEAIRDITPTNQPSQ